MFVKFTDGKEIKMVKEAKDFESLVKNALMVWSTNDVVYGEIANGDVVAFRADHVEMFRFQKPD